MPPEVFSLSEAQALQGHRLYTTQDFKDELERVVFQKWRWPCLYRPFKGIAVHEQANDDIVHLCRFRKANGLADQAFNACA